MFQFLSQAYAQLTTTTLALLALFLNPHPLPPPPSPIHFTIPQIETNSGTFLIPDPFLLVTPPIQTHKKQILAKKLLPPYVEKQKATSTDVFPPLSQFTHPEVTKANTLEDWQSLNTSVARSSVNLLCTIQKGNLKAEITGSGVVVDSRGVILTNAHLAQYFLLEDEGTPGISCKVRTGSPATGSAKATLLTINKAWLNEHSSDVSNFSPYGTGENDFGLLLLTTGSKIHPPELAIAPQSYLPKAGDKVITAGYPFPPSNISPESGVKFVSVLTEIRNIDSFSFNSPDLLFFGGSLVAEHGSSGGPVVNENGLLSGIIVTATPAATVDMRESRAISLHYIQENFSHQYGISFSSYIHGNLNQSDVKIPDTQKNALREYFINHLTFGR